MQTVHLIVSGRVQGVFYRASTKKIADKLGIKGWVKNTDDAEVEITATGSEEALKEFIEWCKEGPPMSKVSKVEEKAVSLQSFEDFIILR